MANRLPGCSCVLGDSDRHTVRLRTRHVAIMQVSLEPGWYPARGAHRSEASGINSIAFCPNTHRNPVTETTSTLLGTTLVFLDAKHSLYIGAVWRFPRGRAAPWS